MDWVTRAKEQIQDRNLFEFVIDGSSFVFRRIASRIIVMSLDDVNKNATSTCKFGSANSITIEVGEEEIPDSYTDRIGTYESPQSFVNEFNDARLVGPFALGLTGPGSVITETAGGNLHLLWPTVSGMIKQKGVLSTTRSLWISSEPEREYECAVSLVSFNADNYYHWILEHLPQLRGVEIYAENEGVSPTLLLPENPPSWMIESLEACNYDESDWVEWSDGSATVKRLVVPEHPFRSMEIEFPPNPENCQWLRERIVPNIDPSSTDELTMSPYVYISREDADSRRVVNREKLLAELRPLGFKSYALSELSFEQQVALFSQAEVIIAPHGAGAANMVFASNATFIELCHSENVRGAHFLLLTHECGHNYINLLCEPAGRDMKVDTQQVVRQITSQCYCRSEGPESLPSEIDE